jgi:hypothetical protein
MGELIPILQAVSVLAWGGVLVDNAPATLRIVRGLARHDDVTRGLMFFLASVQIAFASRWLFYPAPIAELDGNAFWAGAYVLSIACALASVWIIGASEKARRDG